jgi:hypothetical protein
MGTKSRIQRSDLFDFLLPNINVNGHLIFKVRIARLSGEVRIGFVDVFRIPHGVSLDADWSWPGFPTWHLDSSGGLNQFGQDLCQATTKLNENDIVVADLDQNQVPISLQLFRMPSTTFVPFCVGILKISKKYTLAYIFSKKNVTVPC